MKTKEIIQNMSEDSSKASFAAIVQALIEDAQVLIKTRNAKQASAQRSCYMEQDQKWRSAYAKLIIQCPESMTNYTADSVLLAFNASMHVSNSILQDDGTSSNVRGFDRDIEVATQKLAHMIANVFAKAMECARDDKRISESTDEARKLTAGLRGTIRYLAGDIIDGHTKTAKLTRQDVDQLISIFTSALAQARKSLPTLRDSDVSMDNVTEVFRTIPVVKEAMQEPMPTLHELASLMMIGRNIAQGSLVDTRTASTN